jgi:phosphoheptose isomerase/osmotically-inducible protein OsmY
MLEQRIQQQFFDSADLKYAAAEILSKPIADAVNTVVGCITAGGKVLACGNGGSASDAQHFAAEFVGRFERERPGLAAIALTTDTSILTAIGNDYDFNSIYSKQVQALGAPGDVLIAITTSGNSAACQGDDRCRSHRAWRGQAARAARRDRCAHLRAPRAHRAHPGSPYPRAALPVRRRRPAAARRTGKHMTHRSNLARPAFLLAAVAAATLLSACAPLLVGGAVVGTSMMVTDRRTSGTQVEDQSIELKAMTRTREAVGERGHVNATSYNRTVLLTGEMATENDKAMVEQAIAKIEGVRTVVNELVVAGSSSLAGRSTDAILTSKVKASFLDAKDVFANAIKVVTERSTVYLMGRVTEREANRASDIARGVGGVQKVVRVFEVITEAELADLQPKQGIKQ